MESARLAIEHGNFMAFMGIAGIQQPSGGDIFSTPLRAGAFVDSPSVRHLAVGTGRPDPPAEPAGRREADHETTPQGPPGSIPMIAGSVLACVPVLAAAR
jgi:hypothetical protein